jgi:predicted NBD/HSP70 family sugar kinase
MALNYGDFMLPFIEINPGESDLIVKERCEERTDFLVNYLPGQLRLTPDSPLLDCLDAIAPEVALRRIRAMLQRLKSSLDSLSSSNPERLEELNRLDWSPDRRFAASPVLWAIGGLIFSHKKWTAPNCHDVRSAVDVDEFLRTSGAPGPFPQWMSDRIPLLVALKNAYRTCVDSGLREVGVYRDGILHFKEEEIARSMAELLKRACPTAASVTADALLLIANAYAGRYGDSTKVKTFEDFTQLVKQEIDRPVSQFSGILVIFEFGRHVFPALESAKTPKKLATELLKNQNPQVVWVSFDRFWATRHSDSLRAWLEEKAKLPSNLGTLFRNVTEEIQFSRGLQARLGSSNFYALSLEKDDASKVAFGCLPDKPTCQQVPTTVWQRISLAIKPFLERRGQTSGTGSIPWAYVMRVLDVLAYIYPIEFFRLKILRPDSPKELGDSNIIVLPREVPDIEELENAVKQEKWHHPKLLVSRCLATLLINQRMAFGNKQQAIRIDGDQAITKIQELEQIRDKWLKLATWVSEKNKHGILEKYLQVCLTPKIQLQTEPLLIFPQQGEAQIAGFDIGGSFVKAAIYKYYPKTELLGEPVFTEKPVVEFQTRNLDGTQYENALSFVERINTELTKAWGENWQENLIAIGITWPGAIAGQPGSEYIAAYSTAIGYFKPFDPDKFFQATAEKIHQFDLRQAFQNYFQKPVILMNDGVAHVLYHQWQFNREILGVGETVVGLFAGTGSAEAVFDGDTGHPLNVLAELGKQIDDIGCPFPVDEYPSGTSRNYFNKDTLPRIGQEVLQEWGIEMPRIPGILIGWILENLDTHASEEALKKIQQKIQRLWEEETRPGAKSIDSYLKELKRSLNKVGKKDEDFAKEVTKRAGLRLADLIAQVRELYGSLNVFVGGGPMSGATGRFIRNKVREELQQGYGFDVVGDESDVVRGIGITSSYTAWKKHHRVRLIRFPEPPRTNIEPPGPSGVRGAAMTAVELFTRKSSVPVDRAPSFSAFTVLQLGKKVSGRVYFPGRDSLPHTGTAGYVRSHLQASQAWKVVSYEVEKEKKMSIYSPLPWRDYDEDSVLTPIDVLIQQITSNDERESKTRNHIIISARNTINEWRYQIRMDGKWYRRLDDSEIDQDWPVIEISDQKVCLLPYKEASKETDLVTGIPLVIDGKPVSRTFLIANCSDIAHIYEVNPQGRLSSSATAWRELSECWKRAKDRGVEDYEIEQRMNKIANCYVGVQESRNLLHSIMAVRHDGELIAFAITGGLSDIAKELATKHQVRHAVLLDNGGSVGWHTLLEGKNDRVLLVASPNYRPRGMVFIDFWVEGFVHPREHYALSHKTAGG